jgi:hypothetical protein
MSRADEKLVAKRAETWVERIERERKAVAAVVTATDRVLESSANYLQLSEELHRSREERRRGL